MHPPSKQPHLLRHPPLSPPKPNPSPRPLRLYPLRITNDGLVLGSPTAPRNLRDSRYLYQLLEGWMAPRVWSWSFSRFIDGDVWEMRQRLGLKGAREESFIMQGLL
jgi:hypothetical protein